MSCGSIDFKTRSGDYHFKLRKNKEKTMKRLITLIFTLIVFLNFAGCDCPDDKNQGETWDKKILSHRAKTDSSYANSPNSPFSGLNRFTLEKDGDHFFIYKGSEFSIGRKPGPGILLKIWNEKEQWHWEAFNDGLTLKSKDRILTNGLFPLGRAEAIFERYYLALYILDEKMVIIVFDPEREAIVNFKQLFYYPPDPSYRVTASMEIFPNFETVEMITSRNLIKSYYRYAKINFEIKGEKKVLMAYKSDLSKTGDKSWLFIPFKDNTTGSETYGAGRFLELKEPQSDTFVLDFNLAFNPLCNYADVYNCSYPPPENHLDIAIEAGEKTYPMAH